MRGLWMVGGMLGALVLPVAAAPVYQVRAESLPSVEIRSTEPEVDALLRAVCVARGTLDVRFGGELSYGDSERAAATLALAAGDMTTRVDGIVVKSPDFEMTGGMMLLTSLSTDGRAVRILTSGKPLAIRAGAGDGLELSLGDTATATLKALVDQCG